MTRLVKWRSLLVAGLLLTIAACTYDQFALMLQGDSYLNIDHKNNSLPVLIKVFQLKSAEKFQQASFRDIWKHAGATLGATALASEDHMVYPNTKIKLPIIIETGTKYIAITGIFRRTNSEEWKVIYKLREINHYLPKLVTLNFKGNSIKLVR